MLQLIGSTLVDVVKKENLTEGKLQRIMDGYKIDEVNCARIKRIGLLGIDEIAKLKGQDEYITLFKHSPAIKAAFRLARELTHIYNTHHRKATAKRKMTAWINKVNDSDVTCLTTFTKMLMKYQTSVCNYFMRRETSGWVEGINNKVKVSKRRCYGLINLKHFFQRIFLDLQGYDIFLTKQQLIVRFSVCSE